MDNDIEPMPDEPRASFLLRVAARHIRRHAVDQVTHYADMPCSGGALALECEGAAEQIRDAALDAKANADRD